MKRTLPSPASVYAGIALSLFGQPARALQTSASLRIDNDFFNLWESLASRPDEEYTQGAQLAIRWSGTGIILPHLFHGLERCPNGQAGADRCGRMSLALGQDMYTPSIDSPHLIPGQRPYAGWLYLESTERAESVDGMDVVRYTVGITGPPSLAEATQDTWHRWFNYRAPLGWDEQLPTEADFAVGYESARMLGRVGGSDHPRVLLASVWALNAGTLLTDLELSLRATVGGHPPLPWSATVRHSTPGLGVYLLGAVRGDVVARNLFLDGTTFRDSHKVTKRSQVGQLEGGVGLSVWRARFEWTVIHRGTEYITQPRAHTYARLTFGWE
jgi:lipid A 3-O-deacylase